MNNKSLYVVAIALFLGLYSLGSLLSGAFIKTKELERTVVVKGLSEKEVDSNRVIWPIKISVLGNDYNEVSKKIEDDTQKVVNFLEINGVKKEFISVASPVVQDKYEFAYNADNNVIFRYSVARTIMVSSDDVKNIKEINSKLFELSQNGVTFKYDEWDPKTAVEYSYTKLNDIKPKMIEEATANAREVAEKFAKDSKSKLGKIKKATQGQVEMKSRDKNSEDIKTLRVVVTVEYYLND